MNKKVLFLAMIFISLFMMSFISGAIGDAIVADMTADNAPSPLVASASAFDVPFNPFKAFDNDNSTVWYKGSQTTGYLKIDLGAGNEAVAGIVNMRGFDSNSAPKDYTIQGSNNDADWTTLHTVTGQGPVFDGNVSFTNTVAYRYYKIDITAVTGTANAIGIANLQYYDTEETTSSPTITLNTPANYLNQTSSLVNFNISTSDLNEAGTIKNVTLYIDGVLNETNSTETINGTYFFSKYLSYGSHNWSILAYNNNSKSTQSATRFMTIGIFENSRTYLTSITEGSTGNFILNISTGNPITSAYLNYNGTLYSTTISAASGYTTLSTTLSVPLVSATTILPLSWYLIYSGGSWNSTSSNQTVYNFNIDNCSTNTLTFINFTLKDEVSQAKINGTAVNSLGKLNIQIFPFADRTQFYNYSTEFNRTNPFALCFNSTLFTGEKYSFDLEVEYTADDYTIEFYHIQNETLDNSYYNTNISLYPITNTLSKIFKIVYKDASYRAVDDAIIKIYRKYAGDTDPWKITEIPITDYNGETTANLVESNVVYSFYVYKYGELLTSFENVFVKCQYSSIDQCTLYLNSFSSGIDIVDVEEDADFNFTLGYNKTTRVISSNFVIPSGTSHLISLIVITSDSLETSICNDSLTSSSGTVSCTVPNTFGNSTIVAKLYKDGVFQSYGNIKLDQDPDDIYGGVQIFLALFMLFALVGASISGNPVIMIVSFLIGIIALIGLNLVANNGFIGATATALFLVIAIVIVLIKIGRRN